MVVGILVPPDEPVTLDKVMTAIDFSNQLIDAYLTDPPYLDVLLEECVSSSEWTYESLIDKLGELIDQSTKYIQYDICAVKEAIIGDPTGMVMLMI